MLLILSVVAIVMQLKQFRKLYEHIKNDRLEMCDIITLFAFSILLRLAIYFATVHLKPQILGRPSPGQLLPPKQPEVVQLLVGDCAVVIGKSYTTIR